MSNSATSFWRLSLVGSVLAMAVLMSAGAHARTGAPNATSGPAGQPVVNSGETERGEGPAGTDLATSLASGLLPEEVLRDLRYTWPRASKADLRFALETQSERAAITEALSRLAGFAGVHYRANARELVIYLTPEGDAEKAARLARDSLRAKVRVERVRRTYESLVSILERVAQELSSATDRYSTTIDTRRNAVVAAVTDRDASLLESFEGAPGIITRVDASLPAGVPAACPSRLDCEPPLRGGINIGVFNGASSQLGCSTGFTATASNGVRWVWTAGHCIKQAQVDTGTAYGNADAKIGGAKGTAETPTVDVAWVRNSFGFEDPPFGFVYAIGSNKMPISYAITSPATVMEGTVLCLAGRNYLSGDDNCGAVSAQNLGGKPQIRGIKVCGGDSGGSVYSVNGSALWAYGLISVTSARPYNDCTGNGTGEMSFSSIPYVDRYVDNAAPYPMAVDVS